MRVWQRAGGTYDVVMSAELADGIDDALVLGRANGLIVRCVAEASEEACDERDEEREGAHVGECR